MDSIIYSNETFLENNTLDAQDWGAMDFTNFPDLTNNCSPISSLDEKYDVADSSISLTNNEIDCWLNDELMNTIKQEDIVLDTSQQSLSEDSISPSHTGLDEVFYQQESPDSSCPQTYPTISNSASRPNQLPLLNCLQNSANPNVLQQMVTPQDSLPKTAKQLKTLKPILSNTSVPVQSVNNLMKKTILPTTKGVSPTTVSLNPHIVKLENGQYYIAHNAAKTANNKLQSPTTHQKKTADRRKKSPDEEVKFIAFPKNIEELKQYKRQQRLIKNRESACLSRQRKKEHVHKLEIRVSDITAANQTLKQENQTLKQKIQALENELSVLRKNHSGVGLKRSTALLAIIVLVVFNPLKLSSPLSTRDTIAVRTPANIFHSRSLMQVENVQDAEESFYNDEKLHFNPARKNKRFENFENKESKEALLKSYDSLDDDFYKSYYPRNKLLHSSLLRKEMKNMLLEKDCGEQFNKTNLNKIQETLVGLAENSKKEETKRNIMQRKKRKHLFLMFNSTNHYLKKKPLDEPGCNHSTVSSSYFSRKKVSNPKIGSIKSNSSQDIVKAIQKSITRKSDTFYLVSLEDLMVLPATNSSNKARPKVTFMLPAYFNAPQEPSHDTLAMLQIECVVMDTKLVQVAPNALSVKKLLKNKNYIPPSKSMMEGHKKHF